MNHKNDFILVSTLDQLKAISDPLRLRLFEDIRTANQQGRLRTIRQSAESLQCTHAKLYYHVKQLEKHGFIQIADTVFVSGIAEKHYAVMADTIRVDESLLAGDSALEATAATLVSLLRAAFEAAVVDVRQVLQTDPTDDRHIHFDRQLLRLTEAQATSFREKIAALEAEMRAASAEQGTNESTIYSLTTVFSPTVRVDVEDAS